MSVLNYCELFFLPTDLSYSKERPLIAQVHDFFVKEQRNARLTTAEAQKIKDQQSGPLLIRKVFFEPVTAL